MVLKEIAFLASDTARSKAYLECLLKNDLRPAICVVYSDDTSIMYEAEKYEGSHEFGDYFNRDIPLFSLINDYELPYVFVKSKDINSEILEEAIRGLEQEYIIYSGYGGGILKPHLFKLGKKYIHIHAGIVPEYRGSTTAYYSIIDNGKIGVTAFFLNEKLDDGDIICQHEYDMPKTFVDIDYIYEPYLRAQELVRALKMYIENFRFDVHEQRRESAETYYIIHPVLKHLAIKRVLNQLECK